MAATQQSGDRVPDFWSLTVTSQLFLSSHFSLRLASHRGLKSWLLQAFWTEGLLNSSSTPPQILTPSLPHPLPAAAVRQTLISDRLTSRISYTFVSCPFPQNPRYSSRPPQPPRSLDGISQGRILTRLGWRLARLGSRVVGCGRGGGVCMWGDLSPLLCSFSLVHFPSTTSKHCYLCPAFAFTLSRLLGSLYFSTSNIPGVMITGARLLCNRSIIAKQGKVRLTVP